MQIGREQRRSSLLPFFSVSLALALLAILAVCFGNQVRTLASFRKVDDYPLYVMHLYGDYGFDDLLVNGVQATAGTEPAVREPYSGWACSVFAALNADGELLLGRNFDWYNRPTLLLFTHPPDGLDAVSLVDLSYLGFDVNAPSWQDVLALQRAPYWPFDGMNEHGLAVGMMAVPEAQVDVDPQQVTIGSLHAIRLVLDKASSVEEAITHLQSYNIDFEDGPPLHYMLADAAGNSAIVEFIDGELVVLRNKELWQVATNFLVSGHSLQSAMAQCPRYARAYERLDNSGGVLDQADAMALLQDLSQPITMWSVVYGLASGEVRVVIGRDYEVVHAFQLPIQAR
jgi:hypothetical protein